MKIPLVVRDIEARTEDDAEKNIITKILEMKENSLSKYTSLVYSHLPNKRLVLITDSVQKFR